MIVHFFYRSVLHREQLEFCADAKYLTAAEADFVIVKIIWWSVFIVLIYCTVSFDLSQFAVPLILCIVKPGIMGRIHQDSPIFVSESCIIA